LTGTADPLDPSRALTPVAIRVNETRVRRGFLPKLKRVAARIPFASDAVAVYFAARDPATPATAKGLMLAALAYFVLPTDAIPDIFPVVGFTDDAAVLAAVIALVGSNVKAAHRQRAKAMLAAMAKNAG
jgi:uncharacterized membrane protein YkvA (DUF1232 family)